MNSQKWMAAQPSPKSHMHSTSLNDAINPSGNPPVSSSSGNNAVLRNSTFKMGNNGNNQNIGDHEALGQNSSSKMPSSSYKFQNAPNHSSVKSNPSSSSESKTAPKEVDYYHNPTELFRWINYRRWDGARARTHTNPEECAVWVVSRHSTDGRILWRQLPLHLVTMQCGIRLGENHNDENRDVDESSHASSAEEIAMHNANLEQVEQLIEDLLEAHPEAASLQDDQGMLPLHTCLNSINPGKKIGPNECVLSQLLLANATSVLVRDLYGRTPADIVKEKLKIAKGDTVSQIERALRLIRRAESMNQSIKNSMADDAAQKLRRVEQQSENERLASQRIIRRLEQELAEEQNRAQREVNSAGEMKQTSNILYEELRMVKQDHATMELDLEQARKERDDLVAKNDRLRNEMDKQEQVVSKIKADAGHKVEEQGQIVASLKSEVNTARAMAEGMESQLRSKFSNEEELRSSVTQVRKEMATMASQTKREKKKLMEDIERLEDEFKHTKTFAEELEKKNETLEQRNADLDKHLGQVLVAYNSLSSEYDQLFDSTNRHEVSMMDSISVERNNIAAALEKQKKMFEASIAEQEQLMAQASKKESVLRDMFAQSKKREIEAVGKIKENFQMIRTQLSSKHCLVTETVKKEKVFPIPVNKNAPKNESQHSSTEKSGKETTFITEDQTSTIVNSSSFPQGPSAKKREYEKGPNIKLTPILAPKSEPPAVEIMQTTSPEKFKSPGLLSLLEERAQYSSQRPTNNLSSSRKSENIDSFSSLSEALHSSSKSKEQKRPSPDYPVENTAYSMPSTHHSSSSSKQFSAEQKGIRRLPVMTYGEDQNYSAPHNNDNTKEGMKQWPMPRYVDDTSDSTTAGSYSLDEFSDIDSRISSGVSTFGDPRSQYKGMRHAVKQDLIRVNNGGSNSSSDLRDRYSPSMTRPSAS